MTTEEWRAQIARVPLPRKGCFKGEFPKMEWQEVVCVKAPARPYPPARGPRPTTVGNGNDVSAQVTTGTISQSTGSFDSVTGVTSESGDVGGNPPPVADTFSIQLNSNFFTTPACNNVAGCQGWEQFVYSNSGSAFIQSWLIGFGTCPTTGGPAATGWIQFSNDCFGNSNAVAVPIQTIGVLSQLSLNGQAVANGSDTLVLTIGNQAFTTTGDDSVVDLAQGWVDSEFNIVGDCCASQAIFNAGASLVVHTFVDNGTPNAPSCLGQGFTGETNNLSFASPPMATVGPFPAVLFTESTSGTATSACASAISVGDTHLTTFDGLLYDFQASGDFLLMETGDFTVQTRQVSGAPSWPNASLNAAVATQMGQNRIALCSAPTRLMVNGKLSDLADGHSLAVAGGVEISRKGNVYTVQRQTGDVVQVTLNNNNANTWMDVFIGLGRTPRTTVSGLLTNPNRNVHQLAIRNGTVLTEPIPFDVLYHSYADSWRVEAAQSMLCPERTIEIGIPSKAFYASDLDPAEARRLRETCVAEGVKQEALIEACTLDSAVLGDKTAAKVFVGHRIPIHVFRPTLLTRQ